MQSSSRSANLIPLSTGYIKYQWVSHSWHESFKRCSERIFFTPIWCMEIFTNIFIRSDSLHHSWSHSKLRPRMRTGYSKKSQDRLKIHFQSTDCRGRLLFCTQHCQRPNKAIFYTSFSDYYIGEPSIFHSITPLLLTEGSHVNIQCSWPLQ